jgi:hypothetical protein
MATSFSFNPYVIALSVLGFCLCYLPLMIPFHNNRAAEMVGAFGSNAHTYYLIWSMAVAFHLCFEVLVDYKLSWGVNLPRIFVISALGFPNILKLLYFSLPAETGTALVICSYYGQDILVVGGLISSLLQGNDSAFSSLFGLALTSVLIACELVYTFEPFLGRDKYLLYFFSALSIIMFLVILGISLKRIISAGRVKSVQVQFTAVFIACLLWNIIAKWLIYFLFGSASWPKITGTEMACRGYVDIITAMIAFTLPGRLATWEANKAQVRSAHSI